MMNTDLTFFTNEPNASLRDRFNATLANVKFFDILVGYFRTSGLHLLSDALAEIDHIRVLVGLTIDREAFDMIEKANEQRHLQFEATKTVRERFAADVEAEMATSPDDRETERSVRRFIDMLQSGQLRIKGHPSQQIHAKVYISRFNEGDRDFGRVITGSSNFSYPGLLGQYEFNVELKNAADVRYALDKFEALWEEAVDISEAYLDTIRHRTWLSDQITPYQIYLKLLYEYFKEDIDLDETFDRYLPDNFLDLEYQKQAVIAAKKILDAYNGVFLADVVGLGKTYVSAMLAQQLPGRKLVICPPVLQEYWRDTFIEFNVGGTRVESLGKLEHLIQEGHDRYDYVFIDEAHRFRNEDTQSYEQLHQICWGKKVILVSATPLNNRVSDIFALIKLFQSPRNSTIPGLPNIERFFNGLERRINREEKGTPAHAEAVKQVAAEVRDNVLNYLMVRRTRSEIVNYFNDDVATQGLAFPQLADPQRIIYTFDAETDRVFTETIERLKEFRYARYMPLLYMRRELTAFEQQSQRNVGGFMKGILVKRLESSFYAFKKTLGRFIESYERFIEMFDAGTVYISKDINVYDLLAADREEELLHLVEEERVQRYDADDFTPSFRDDLAADLQLLVDVQALWQQVDVDPKLDQFITELRMNPLLGGQKVIVFTESAETADYLYRELDKAFPKLVMAYSSSGGVLDGGPLDNRAARDVIAANYDPRHRRPRNDLRILITTDVLAEGVNLHRSNVVINYDLPWNPTRVLQRVGRVNRVGTTHQNVYIFNFFPTDQSSQHISLEQNIKTKIQAFHDMLGEDARYLTEEEDVTQHELFGDRLYQQLNRKESYEGEGEERSELAYLQEIRAVRDREPALYKRIQRLPKKARAGRALPAGSPLPAEAVVTFFRRGMLKKFFLAGSGDGAATELSFLDAVDLLRVPEPATPRLSIPESFYDLLARNKQGFAEVLAGADDDLNEGRGNRSNERILISLLKQISRGNGLGTADEQYLGRVLTAFEEGRIPARTSKTIKRAVTQAKTTEPARVLPIFRAHIADSVLESHAIHERPEHPREVILSSYLQVSPAEPASPVS